MSKAFKHILLVGLLLTLAWESVSGQEVLNPARIKARARLKNLPSLGLPLRADGRIDGSIRYKDDRWFGADSAGAAPRWTMLRLTGETGFGPEIPSAVHDFCRSWMEEKPQGNTDIVFGPLRDQWFITVCKKTRSSLGWKSIGFVLPREGSLTGKKIYEYCRSVNWIEHQIRYDLYPKLPSHLQEIIEEMTATELFFPFLESLDGMGESPDRENDYDWEDDYREMLM